MTGEGGSGGALGIGVTDVVLMLEHSVYSVISPEGCAAILWKDQARAREAAEAMRMTAADCKALGVVDEVIPEPPGGAHSDPRRDDRRRRARPRAPPRPARGAADRRPPRGPLREVPSHGGLGGDRGHPVTPAFPPPRVSRSLRPHDPGVAEQLARSLSACPSALARVLAARGIASAEEARAWLEPGPETLHDPFGMAGMPEAVELLARTARRGGRVVVFGDYDCDGVGALAILTTTLKTARGRRRSRSFRTASGTATV